MDSRKLWVRGCLSKKRYSSEKLAKKAAKKVLRERGVELHCYYCNQCFGYHLTKNSNPSNDKVF